ncbi:MAG TPA: VWA domain-containing protein [Pyrinomonadaceae bacterium]
MLYKKISFKTSGLLRLLLCCGLMAVTLYGQSGRRSEPESAGQNTPPAGKPVDVLDDVLRVRTEEVMVPVSVRDVEGKPVNGLTAERFLVYDNGVRQDLASFNRERVPANIVLLLDASGSVFHQMRFIREAAQSFIEGLLKEDRVCVMQFADRVELLQDWTSAANAVELTKALEWRYHPGESTAFYDGLYLAAEEQLRKTEGRRIIILLTDGIDTAEVKRASLAEAVNSVRRAEASVYVVSLTASLREAVLRRTAGTFKRLLGGYDPKEVKRVLALIDESEAKLEGLAAQTGGRMFLPRRDEELLPAYKAIAEELRTQYILTYRPKPRVEAGQWRRLRVLVLPGGYEVAAREGYKGRT